MKKTWRWQSLSGDAPKVMASASTVVGAAKALGVDRVTLQRWIRSGRVPPPGGRRRRTGLPVAPDGWAAAVRAAYLLDATETVLVELAEAALGLARDASLKPADRLAAMARFAQLTKQIDLEVPDGSTATTPAPAHAQWPRRV